MITIYTTKYCAYCPAVKRLYDSRGIKYKVIELDDKPDLRQELINKTHIITVPITTNGETYVAGYNVASLIKLAEERP